MRKRSYFLQQDCKDRTRLCDKVPLMREVFARKGNSTTDCLKDLKRLVAHVQYMNELCEVHSIPQSVQPPRFLKQH